MEVKRQVIHSIKVGIALVLVSLLYLLDPPFQRVGVSAMWAIMTVVLVFEFFAGATLSKGINRAIGTILGGGLGCCAAILANGKGEIFEAIVVGSSVFIFGIIATYMRLLPKFRKRFDYAFMVFILTFNLVVVSPVRSDTIMELVVSRFSTVAMGLVICLCISIFVFPMWASDELHYSIASKFEKLASCFDGCFEEFRKTSNDVENPQSGVVQTCKSVLHSKAVEESLANFARWEPWHGKFGIFHPWNKYLEIGEILRELAAIIFTLYKCLQSLEKAKMIETSNGQASSGKSHAMKEPSELVMLSLGWILRELGESIKEMKQCRASVLIIPKLQPMKVLLDTIYALEDDDDEKWNITCSSLLMEIVDKMESLVKQVEGLEELAKFQTKKLDV